MLANGNLFHGDHHPVSVVEGRKSRNLLPTNFINLTNNGLTFTVGPDGIYHVSGTATASSSASFVGYSAWANCDIPAGTYTISGQGGSNNLFGFNIAFKNADGTNFFDRTRYTSDSFELTQNAKQVYCSFRAPSGAVLNHDVKPMLNEGSTPLPYEPYGTVTDPIFTPTLLKKSGTELTFEKSYNHAAEVSIDGRSEQRTLSGKNLLDYDSMIPGFSSGGANETINPESGTDVKTTQRLYVKPSTTYTLHMKTGLDVADQASNKYLWFSVKQFEQDGTFVLEGVRSHESTSVEKIYTFTTQARTGFLRISFRTYDTLGKAWAQLEEGSTATDYEPYCGGIPSPNPDYPQPIECVESVELVSSGRNLIGTSVESKKLVISGSYYNDIGTKSSFENFKLLNEFKMEARKGYTLALKVESSVEPFNISVGAGNGYFGRDVASVTNRKNGWNYMYFVPTEEQLAIGSTLALRPCRYPNRQDRVEYTVSKVMLLDGNVQPAEDDYEPYHSTTRTIDLQGHQLRSLPDGTKDDLRVKRDGRVELVQRVWSEVISRLDNKYNKTGGIPCFYGSVLKTENTPLCSGGSVDGRIICSGYKQGMYPWDARAIDFVCNTTTQTYPKSFYVTDSRFDNINDFNAWLVQNPITVNYRLLEPKTIPLPSIDPLPTYWPTTVIYDEHGNDISAYVKVVE